MITRMVSMRSLFRHNAHQWNLMSATWLVGLEPNSYQNKMLFTWLEAVYDSRSHQNKTTQDKWQKWRKDGCPLQTDVIFVVIDVLENVFIGEVPIIHCHENGDCQEPEWSPLGTFTRNLSCNKQLMFSNQNTQAFRPNSITAPCKAQWRLHRADFLVFSDRYLCQSSIEPFRWGWKHEAFRCRRGLVFQAAVEWSHGACIRAINLRFVTQHIQRQSQENAILPKSTS